MRQFDIVALSNRTFAIVLQADLLDSVNTRVVAPLVRDKSLTPIRQLQPVFRIGRHDYIMMTDKLGAVLLSEISRVVGAAKDREWDIRRALDMVFLGV